MHMNASAVLRKPSSVKSTMIVILFRPQPLSDRSTIPYRKRDDTFLKQWKAFCGKHPEILDVLRRTDAQRGLLSRLKMFVKARL